MRGSFNHLTMKLVCNFDSTPHTQFACPKNLHLYALKYMVLAINTAIITNPFPSYTYFDGLDSLLVVSPVSV